MRLLILFAFFIQTTCFAQVVPGKALQLAGPGNYVNFGEVLSGTRTISFWIKPNVLIDNLNATEKPVLVRDQNDPILFSTGEFAIYFGKTGGTEAGHLVFMRSTVNAPYKIKSDANTWNANQWYHVAAVLDETNGMRLFINGVLQQETDSSTDPIYIRNEGPTGDLYLGRWGFFSNGYGIQAEIDELRFYNFALSELEVRNRMCHVEGSANLKGYYTFDNATSFNVPTSAGGINGQPAGLSNSSFVKSNAPVGQTSGHLYDFTNTSVLLHTNQATIILDSMYSSAEGVHIYATPDGNLIIPGSLPYFYGVWFTGTSAVYRAKIEFGAVAANCDSCSEIKSRDYQTTSNWTTRTNVPQNCVYTMPNESPGGLNYREEYWVTPFIEITSGLDSVITECEGTKIHLIPTNYPGAKYVWEDGSTQRTREVDSAGMYIVNIKWHGCTVTDTVWANYSFMPYFTLPNDTAICIGDTLVLTAPLDIDSASYIWGGGLGYGRNFRMYYAGTISLIITVGNCSWEDEITVDLIRNFPLNLGKDTTLCLGEELLLELPPGVDFTWSNGHPNANQRIFNQSGTYWVSAWNPCFAKSDTINITYKDCECYFYIPNAFSPNNDGINDIFLPISSCIYEEFELMIFDRWGNQVFITTDVETGWDGTYKGKKLPLGVYTYQFKYKKFTSLETSMYEQGTITLIE